MMQASRSLFRRNPQQRRKSSGWIRHAAAVGGVLFVCIVLFTYDDYALSEASLSVLINQPQQIPSTIHDDDDDCPFRDSPIYKKVYVYPNHGDMDNGWSGDMLSEHGKDPQHPRWPFLDLDSNARAAGTGHYNTQSQNVQYTTELLVREIMTHPNSCLRTYDPEDATLFYVPYLPSIEHHRGLDGFKDIDFSTSPYGQAIMDILDRQDYSGWEKHFGLTSKYWKRREGADHILVFSEPMHGLYHPRSKRGNFHFIHSQKQLTPPIVISVELSTTFVEMYPKCAAKNILMPYPNTDGTWFNGKLESAALQLLHAKGNSTFAQIMTSVALPAEQELDRQTNRPVPQFYSAGNHGTCAKLRKAMKQDYEKCAPSFSTLSETLQVKNYALGMRLSTFCPCPGGDSPSAKRHYDALIAQCIPIILSRDFVWPFTHEFDSELDLDPKSFALRLPAEDYDSPLLDPNTCQPVNESRRGLQHFLESIPAIEIARLREGVERARKLYAWYEYDAELVDNPLRDGVLPTGGAAHQLVKMLAERANGVRWPACREELKLERGPDVNRFKC